MPERVVFCELSSDVETDFVLEIGVFTLLSCRRRGPDIITGPDVEDVPTFQFRLGVGVFSLLSGGSFSEQTEGD